ncbi:uncharacterized protein F4822DRAFT_389604 [Hypoxylon trugodes]|uniref:uncharacterized protein n=1 Tax=Hypoxylon trugodes TaxID=326681 RepID=UPI0021A22337|nr:uncharacterized protein F4822DRAFT_389604 [Hypoxylon trugodes]KAI1392091.1 hypothetical protein F4822DRAFT_389604 [Hypoxylon trugodes]
MATETVIQNGPTRLDRLSAEDFETASIRSAAPSYISEAPSYHSTIPTNESAPAYTPRESHPTPPSRPPGYASSSMLNISPPSPSSSTPTPMTSTFAPGAGLPRIPSPRRRTNDVPQLAAFSIPSWSSMHSNPTARHYQRVAHRRVSAANGRSWGGVETALRSAVERMNAAAAADDADPYKVRPLEDPYLVGEEAAATARRERLARQNGDDILYREERRWDWFLGQTKDWDERDRSWNAFRNNFESQGRLARRFGR